MLALIKVKEHVDFLYNKFYVRCSSCFVCFILLCSVFVPQITLSLICINIISTWQVPRDETHAGFLFLDQISRVSSGHVISANVFLDGCWLK